MNSYYYEIKKEGPVSVRAFIFSLQDYPIISLVIYHCVLLMVCCNQKWRKISSFV